MDSRDAENIERFVDTKIHPLAEAIRQAAEKNAKEQTEKNKDILIEMNSKTFDKAQSYTTVIVAAAYGGIFAVWSSSKDNLPPRGSIVIAICLTVSLTFYILYEVAAIATRTYIFLGFRREISTVQNPNDLAKFLNTTKLREAKAGQHFIPYYAVSLFVTLVPALLASALLVYNNIAKLLAWPLWPT